jgi:hypothetical protein
MSATAQLSELAELRGKTDRELVSIIENALEVGLLIAATDTHVDSAGPLQGRAEEIYANTLMLISKVENLGERRRLESRLQQLLAQRDQDGPAPKLLIAAPSSTYISKKVQLLVISI